MALRWNKPLLVAYRNTFLSPDGKKVLADLRKRCPLLTQGVGTGNGIDVNTLLIQEGQSNVLKHIYTMLKRDPNEETVETAINDLRIDK